MGYLVFGFGLRIFCLLQVDGTLTNTGHDVKLVLDDTSNSASAAYVNISGGPLAYQYRIHELSIHFGRDDTRGSEHSIENRHFPAEVFRFTRATLCYRGIGYGSVSVCLSVCPSKTGIVSKRLNGSISLVFVVKVILVFSYTVLERNLGIFKK